MAHVKIQYDVMDAFCMDVFQRFRFHKRRKPYYFRCFITLRCLRD